MEKKKTGYPHIDKPWMKYYKGLYIPTDEPKTNMVELLKERNKYRKNKTAYEYYGKETSYEEMFYNADVASKVLTQLGVKKGDIIMSLVPNIPEEEELWFGATQIGAITDYVDPRPDSMDIMANAKKILEIIKAEKPKYIITIDKCYLGMLKPIENELKELGINDIILLDPTASMNEEGFALYSRDALNYERLKKGQKLILDDISLDELKMLSKKIKEMQAGSEVLKQAISTSPLNIYDYKKLFNECKNNAFEKVTDENLINYIGHTSGTSGNKPKPITLTNKNAIASVIQCEIAGVGPKEGETSLHILPGFAPFGRYNNDIQSYYNKGSNIHIPEFVIGEFGYLLKEYKPNAIMTPPSFLTSLSECEYLKNEDLSHLTKVIYGGDAMTYEDEEKLNEWLKSHGSRAEVEKGHGMSEYCGCGSYAKDEYNKPNTIGIPAPKTIYTIIDPAVEDKIVPLKFEDDMNELRGEIAVSAEHVTEGKLHGKTIVPHQELDGKSYIRTKDIGYMDKDGCFFIDERKGRSFARIDGFKVKPSEIEKVIETNPNVKYARIVPYFDEQIKGIMPICHVVLEEKELNEEEEIEVIKNIIYNTIIDHSDMNSRQIPSKFKIRENLPLNKGGKVDFKALEKEELTGDEINVLLDETNVSINDIKVFKNKKKGITRTRIKK